MDCLSLCSEPILRARLSFQMMYTGLVARLAEIAAAFSNAAMRGGIGTDRSRQLGSIPKESLQIVSYVNLFSTSC